MVPVSWLVPPVANVSGIVTLPETVCDPMVPVNVGRLVPMPPSFPLRAWSLARFSVTVMLTGRLPQSPV